MQGLSNYEINVKHLHPWWSFRILPHEKLVVFTIHKYHIKICMTSIKLYLIFLKPPNTMLINVAGSL